MRTLQHRRAVIGCLSAIFGIASAQADFSLNWHTIDGGGGTSAGGAFSITGTVGQPDAGPSSPMVGGAFEATGGFWVAASDTCACPGDHNGDGLRNGADVQIFTSCLTSSVNCSCADTDLNGEVNLADAAVFVSQLLAGANCP